MLRGNMYCNDEGEGGRKGGEREMREGEGEGFADVERGRERGKVRRLKERERNNERKKRHPRAGRREKRGGW